MELADSVGKVKISADIRLELKNNFSPRKQPGLAFSRRDRCPDCFFFVVFLKTLLFSVENGQLHNWTGRKFFGKIILREGSLCDR